MKQSIFNSKGFELNNPEAPAANAFSTYAYRANAKDARTGERLNGAAVPVMLTQTGETRRYISLKEWQTVTTPETAAAVHVGKMNNNGLRYQCFIETRRASVALHAAMLAANGNAPIWYATENGYCSPSFANAKWHDKLTAVFELVDAATITVVITSDTTGAVVGECTVHGNRDILGRYVRKDENGKSPLMHLIDKETIKVKGYSNYPELTGAPSAAQVYAPRF